jgi:predicted CxxxxCH...CXXCH cytochrome family protein
MDSAAAATGSHTKHAQGAVNLTCATCHNGYTETGVAAATHVDSQINLSFSGTGAGTSYSQGPASAVQNGYGNCTTSACHSTGQNTTGGLPASYATVTWGATASGCGICHLDFDTNAAATGSHTKHAQGSVNMACGLCHAGYTETSYAAATHLDSNVTLSFSGIAAGTGYSQGVSHPLGNLYGNCSTNYCHSNGKGTYAPPAWGSTSPGCTFCHPTLSGMHASHVIFTNTSVYGNTSANVSGSTANYDFGCGNCHPIDTANHMNGTVQLSLNRLDGGALKALNSAATSTTGTGLATQCNGVYCHSDGKATPTYVQTPRWDTAFTALNSCGNCHGNSPVGANHQSHVVGIHYDTIYTGTSGLATAGAAAANSHGNSAYSTTISCNLCHNNTVPAKSRNMYGSTCSTAACHQGNTANATNAMVTADTNKTWHLNGQPDVAFQAINVKSRAQVRDDITTVAELNSSWTRTAGNYKAGASPFDLAKNALNTATMWNNTTKTCSNIACHNGNAVTWSATLTCGSCHTQVPK